MHKDVVIVGAGISGIGAAYNLQKSCKTKSFTIIEGRSDLGGTWDLFRYPGVRSDSDMHTLGFRFFSNTSPRGGLDRSVTDGYVTVTPFTSRIYQHPCNRLLEPRFADLASAAQFFFSEHKNTT